MNTDFSNIKTIVIGDRKSHLTTDVLKDHSFFTTGHEAWAYALKSDYFNILDISVNQLKEYDFILANLDYNKKSYLRKINELVKQKRHDSTWATLIEGDIELYKNSNKKLLEIFERSDIIIAINKFTLDYLNSITKTKVEYIGVPYPIEAVSKLRIPFESRQRKIFLCTNLLKQDYEYKVAKSLNLPMVGYEKRLHRNIKTIPKIVLKYGTLNPNALLSEAKIKYNDSALTINRDVLINDFFNRYNNAYIWINLDDRYTWGRYVLDAACLQIPIITTKSTGHGPSLFPNSCIDSPKDINKATEIANELINNFSFYKSVAEYPSGKLEEFNASNMVKKLSLAVFGMK